MVKKNVLFLVAAIGMCFAACNNDNEPDGGQVGAFQITMYYISYGYCNFTITPTDKSTGWAFFCHKTSVIETIGGNMMAAMNGLAELKQVYGNYETAKAQGEILEGNYSNSAFSLDEPNTQYTMLVFKVNKELELVGEVYSHTFYSLPNQFVDLGLSSGTLWKIFEEDNANSNPLILTYNEAAERGTIPTREQWEELLNNCSKEWCFDPLLGNCLILVGANGRITGLYSTGKYGSDGKRGDDGECKGYYWTSTQTGSIVKQNDVFIINFDTEETSFGQRPPATMDVCGAILVTENPNKKIKK